MEAEFQQVADKIAEKGKAGALKLTEPLTAAELLVAQDLGSDATYAQIAATRGRSVETIRTQAKSVCAKLGVRTRHAAVRLLAEWGFFTCYGDDTTVPDRNTIDCSKAT